MAVVYLALGSNVGYSKVHIKNAVQLLSGQLANIEQSPVYISKAVGYTDQANFINTVVKAESNLKPKELLKFVKDVEKQVGRIARFRWGPREIDIDIILYNDEVVEEAGLTIPHPRFRDRDFVLKPLCDIDPKIIDPVTKLTVQELFNKLSEDDRSIIN